MLPYISIIEIALFDTIIIAEFEIRLYHHHEDESRINFRSKTLNQLIQADTFLGYVFYYHTVIPQANLSLKTVFKI